jgi:hypothetical protein
MILGWVAMVSTLIVNLYSQVYANKCHSNTISEIDCEEYNREEVLRRRKNIDLMNRYSMWAMLAGIVILLIYISINILNK